MKRRDFVVLLGGTTAAASLAWPLAAGAQSPTILRIGYLASSGPTMTTRMVAALQQGLRDLGYVNGQTLTVEVRQAEGRTERMPELAAELIGLNGPAGCRRWGIRCD